VTRSISLAPGFVVNARIVNAPIVNAPIVSALVLSALIVNVGCASTSEKANEAPYTSPPAATSVTIAGKPIAIQYHAPQMHHRKIFGGLEPYQKVWRAGANDATALHTGATLRIKDLTVPPGDYTVFIWLDPAQWQLIINKQTGQWGLEYHQEQDLGRVPMDMSKPSAPIDKFKITLSSAGANSGKLQMEWETTIASVPFTVN